MPTLHFTIDGPCRTKKNRGTIDTRGRTPRLIPSKPFLAWEESAIPQLRKLRLLDLRFEGKPVQLPITVPCTLEATFYVKGAEGDVGGYLDALCDVLEAKRARQEHARREKKLKVLVPLPFRCDWQIVDNDRQFNAGVSARVERVKDTPRVVVMLTWSQP